MFDSNDHCATKAIPNTAMADEMKTAICDCFTPHIPEINTMAVIDSRRLIILIVNFLRWEENLNFLRNVFTTFRVKI